jgi:hypothetical protein
VIRRKPLAINRLLTGHRIYARQSITAPAHNTAQIARHFWRGHRAGATGAKSLRVDFNLIPPLSHCEPSRFKVNRRNCAARANPSS